MVRSSLVVAALAAAAPVAGSPQDKKPVIIQSVPTPPPVFVPTPTRVPYHTQLNISELPDSKETLGYDKAGNWHVRVDLTLDGGCFANLIYDDYTYLRLSFAPSEKLVFVMIGNKLWRSIDNGQEYEVAVGFDKEEPWGSSAKGIVIGPIHYFGFRLEGGEFIQELRAARLMHVANASKLIGSYDVRGASAALAKLVECQRTVESTVDPFAKK